MDGTFAVVRGPDIRDQRNSPRAEIPFDHYIWPCADLDGLSPVAGPRGGLLATDAVDRSIVAARRRFPLE